MARSKHDAVISIITFLVTLILAPKLEFGIVGIVLSLELCYRSMHRVICLSKNSQEFLGILTQIIFQMLLYISYEVRWFFDFHKCGHFENEVIERVAKTRAKIFIIDAIAINEIDATGQDMLHGYLQDCMIKTLLIFCRVHKPI